jgi:mannose-6-phosphate isomerase-like protein (cupin superfamily)
MLGDGWVKKEGYETKILATEDHLASSGVEVQLVRFHQGKFEHYHKVKTELFHFTSGFGKVVIEGVESVIVPGTTLLIHPGMRHMFVNESPDIPLEAMMVKTNNNPNDTFSD